MTFAGGIKINWLPEDELDRPSCALDVAALGGCTQTEVATILGVSKERVRQLEESGLKKMREPMADENW